MRLFIHHMQHISSYPSIYAIGHRAIANIFDHEVFVEEKVDGSQFSFSRNEAGELSCRSKGKDIIIEAPEKMFTAAIKTAMELPLHPGWVYRGEYLSKPKHNTLAYSRVPKQNIILFDVQTGVEQYLSYDEKAQEARRLGLEVVPLIFRGIVSEASAFAGFLENDSILGGCKIEGLVVKNYQLFTQEKKIALGKYVSEAFKEKHQKEWKISNPGQQDVIQSIINELKTEARWLKAIQHLRDAGELEGSPRDIGAIMKEIPQDILKDEEDEIRDRLFAHFWPQIRRGVTGGLPEFYKQYLMQSAFTPSEPAQLLPEPPTFTD